MIYKFRLIDSSYQKKIVRLRKQVFQKKYGSLVDLSGLEWNRTDQYGTHIAAFNQDELISILRLSYIDTAETFERLLQFSPQDPFSSYPSFCLSRAATATEVAGQNVNMALRLIAYQLIKNSPRPAEFVYGTAMADSKRIQTLKDLGYEVMFHEKAWRGYLNSDNKLIAVFRLPISKLNNAIASLSSRYTPSELSRITL